MMYSLSDPNGSKMTPVDPNGSEWPKWVKNDPNGSEWPRVTQMGAKAKPKLRQSGAKVEAKRSQSRAKEEPKRSQSGTKAMPKQSQSNFNLWRHHYWIAWPWQLIIDVDFKVLGPILTEIFQKNIIFVMADVMNYDVITIGKLDPDIYS